MRGKSVGTQSIPGTFKEAITIGYITVPAEEDRDSYISTCFGTGRVSIMTENAEIIHKVPIGINSLNVVKFPKERGKIGSPVLITYNKVFSQHFVTDVFNSNDEFQPISENDFILTRKVDDEEVSVVGKGNKGSLFLTASKEAHISIGKKTKKGKLDLQVHGDATVGVQGKLLKIITDNEAQIEVSHPNTKDKTIVTIKKDTIQIVSPKIILGKGEEPLVLGDTLKSVLEDLINAIGKITVPTAMGPSGVPINAPQFQKISKSLNKILSKLSFTD